MKGGRFDLSEPEPEEPGMLMTSMIDVIFILLAFFICVTEIKKGKLEVDVPEVAAADASAEAGHAEPIVVEITADDRIFVDGVQGEDEEHVRRLLEGVAQRRGLDVPVQLSGDRASQTGTLMRVVSRLSQVGLKRIEFVVEAGGK